MDDKKKDIEKGSKKKGRPPIKDIPERVAEVIMNNIGKKKWDYDK